MTMKLDLLKFPRTRHLVDAGGSAVTRDDLLMTNSEAKRFLQGRIITVEEKLDGANIGFSIDENYRIRAQNRSHFVTSSSHKQFSTLDSWVSKNNAELFRVLENGRYILYGEWMYAKHSIFYTNLPSYFIAFDIYDTKNQCYLSRKEREKLLTGGSIKTVPLIAEKEFKSTDELLQYLDTKSAYYDGPVEGIYLRIDADAQKTGDSKSKTHSKLVERSKIVRPDFLQQIEEQWTKQKFTKNICECYQ